MNNQSSHDLMARFVDMVADGTYPTVWVYLLLSCASIWGVLMKIVLLGFVITKWRDLGGRFTLVCMALWGGLLAFCYKSGLPPATFFGAEAMLILLMMLRLRLADLSHFSK